jgi:hypothetical protein
MTLADRALAVALLAATGLFVDLPSAHAQSAEAEMLFRDGRKLIKDGKLAAGCDKLEASSRLEPSVGTLLNLGDCREKLGKVASAWAAFRKAEAMAKRAGNDDKRQGEASRRAAQLEPNLSNLVIDVQHRVDGLVVRRDGEVIERSLWSTAIPLDPGGYKIVAEAPGYTPWRMDVVLGPKTKRQVVSVPQLARAAVARTPEPVPAPVVAVAPEITPAQPAADPVITVRRGTWSPTRKFSVGLAMLGVGALGTGVYFGVRATDLQDQADARCPLTACADPEALRLNSKAQDNATRANVLYVAGGAAVATATVLWFVGRPGEGRVIKPTFTDGHVGVSYGGSF